MAENKTKTTKLSVAALVGTDAARPSARLPRARQFAAKRKRRKTENVGTIHHRIFSYRYQ